MFGAVSGVMTTGDPVIAFGMSLPLGVEITSEIADSEHSIILNQVENGVAVRMAIIYLLAGSVNRT